MVNRLSEEYQKSRAELFKKKRDSGLSLREIGESTGITRERVRQILIEFYGSTDVEGDILTISEVMSLTGCSGFTIERLVRKGIIQRIRFGRFSSDVVSVILKLRSCRICRICGKQLPRERHMYCSDACRREGWRFRYRDMSDEQKERYKLAQKRWMVKNPEKLRAIRRRASIKHYRTHPGYRREYYERTRNTPGYKERCRVYSKLYYQRNRESRLKRALEYRLKNPEKLRQYRKKYYQENREKFLSYSREQYRRIKSQKT